MQKILLILVSILFVIACSSASGGKTDSQHTDDSSTLTESDSLFSDDSLPLNDEDTVAVSSWKKITAGGMQTCGIKSEDSKLYCWGGNNHGQLGDGTAEGKITPCILP